MATICAVLSLNNKGVNLKETRGLGDLPPWNILRIVDVKKLQSMLF